MDVRFGWAIIDYWKYRIELETTAGPICWNGLGAQELYFLEPFARAGSLEGRPSRRSTKKERHALDHRIGAYVQEQWSAALALGEAANAGQEVNPAKLDDLAPSRFMGTDRQLLYVIGR